MALQPLSRTLKRIERDPRWASHRAVQMLQQMWTEAVGSVVAQHTAPLSIQRGVLSVATSTGSWAQNLVFQKKLILQKLNTHLPTPLTDLRFLPGEWHRRPSLGSPTDTLAYRGAGIPSQHARPQTPTEALERYRVVIQARQQQLPKCPQCRQAATPEELQRWNLCSPCWIRHIRRP